MRRVIPRSFGRTSRRLGSGDALREGTLGGDGELVKVATDTLARLVKDGDSDGGQVVDLKKEGDDRGGKRDGR